MDYRRIIEDLVESGRITQEELDLIAQKHIPAIEQNVVDMIHMALCNEEHDEGGCKFYDERFLDTRWEKPSHVKWLSISRKIMKRFNLTPDQLMDEITKCVKCVESLNAPPESFRAHFTADLLLNTTTTIDLALAED
jgi:hypothetical protein